MDAGAIEHFMKLMEKIKQEKEQNRLKNAAAVKAKWEKFWRRISLPKPEGPRKLTKLGKKARRVVIRWRSRANKLVSQ